MELMKTCRKCLVEFPETVEFFHRNGKKGLTNDCKRCATQRVTDSQRRKRQEYNSRLAKWRNENRDRYREIARTSQHKLRMEVLMHYSSGSLRCACCSESEERFLCVDHIHGAGNEHRRKAGLKAGSETYRWLKKNSFPRGFRVLCHNCNMATALYGECPHRAGEAEDEDHYE